MPQKLVIKGIREGLLAILSDGEWNDVRQELLQHIDGQADFLKGGRLALDVGNQVLKAVEMGSLRDALSERGLSLWAVIGNSPTTEQTAQTLGLATRLSKPRPDRAMHTAGHQLQSGEQAILVRRTLRSGFSLHHPRACGRDRGCQPWRRNRRRGRCAGVGSPARHGARRRRRQRKRRGVRAGSVAHAAAHCR